MKNDIYPFQILLFEGTGSQRLGNQRLREVTGSLLDKGYSVTRISADQASDRLAPPGDDVPLLVLGEFGSNTLEITAEKRTIDIPIEDITGMDAATILQIVEDKRSDQKQELNSPGQQGAWKPWFPVIDYDRCTNCMQCLSFCLFDVYGVDDDQQIQVQNNDNCKTNCPACSRVCPEVAIMFPKYTGGPINGSEVAQSDLEREKMKVDITSLLGGDIYSSLRTRSEKAKSRFSKERSPDKALNERKRCLTKLQQSGIIPPEVLAELDLNTLPSADEIQRKAEQLAQMQGLDEK